MDWLISLGYIGLFLGCVMAGSVIPVSSDIVMIAVLLAGADPIICMFIGTVGYWLGSLSLYGIGWMGKWEWLKPFKISEETIREQKIKFDKYGIWMAFFPWFPIAGRLASITMGFYKIKPLRVAIYMLIGCFIRFLIWTLLYMAFAEQVVKWFG